jgi:hypothetical protein
MTAHLDSEDTDHITGRDSGESAAGTREARAESEASPLHRQARDWELARRLDWRLPRCELPDIELLRLQGMWVPIQRYLSGRVVIEFLPGGSTASSQDGDRVTLRQAHMNRRRALERMDTKPIFVISAVPEALDPANGYFDPGGLTLCDPELLIADALGLPTVQEGDARHYRRLSLITRRGCIEKVIFPSEKDIEHHTRRVISWMQTARW